MRSDFEAIAAVITEGARVLDLGCGDGALLAQLVESKRVVARGVEISEDNVRAAIARGLSVRHGNIEEGLADYRDDTFDYVILSQTLAYLDHPQPVVREMLRVGQYAVISFDNAGYWRARARALMGLGMGSALTSGESRQRAITLPQFRRFSAALGARVVKAFFLHRAQSISWFQAQRASTAVFVIARGTPVSGG